MREFKWRMSRLEGFDRISFGPEWIELSQGGFLWLDLTEVRYWRTGGRSVKETLRLSFGDIECVLTSSGVASQRDAFAEMRDAFLEQLGTHRPDLHVVEGPPETERVAFQKIAVAVFAIGLVWVAGLFATLGFETMGLGILPMMFPGIMAMGIGATLCHLYRAGQPEDRKSPQLLRTQIEGL